MDEKVKKIILGSIIFLTFSHLFIIFNLGQFLIEILRPDITYFNLIPLFDFIQNNLLLCFFLIVILQISIFIVDNEKLKSAGIYLSFYFYFLIVIAQLFISYLYFKFGDKITILLWILFMFIFLGILKINFGIRTDKEMLNSGFDRIPNTVEMIRNSGGIMMIILLFLIWYNKGFELNDNYLIYFLIVIFFFGIYLLIIFYDFFNLFKLYRLRKFDNEFLRLRKKHFFYLWRFLISMNIHIQLLV